MKTLAVPVKPPRPPKNNRVAVRPPSSCANCKYFEKNTETCQIFFSQNSMSGEIVYYDADIARMDEFLCGWSGKHFKHLENTNTK